MASTSTRRISGCRPRSSTSTYLVGKKIASKIYLENGHCVLYHEPSDTYRFHSRIHRRAAEKMFPEDVPTASITGRDGVMTEAIRDGVITEDGVMTEAIRDGVMTEAIRDRVYTDAELPNWQVRGPGTWPRCLGAAPPWPRCLAGIPGMAWFLHRDMGDGRAARSPSQRDSPPPGSSCDSCPYSYHVQCLLSPRRRSRISVTPRLSDRSPSSCRPVFL